jgi:hypothetical protein
VYGTSVRKACKGELRQSNFDTVTLFETANQLEGLCFLPRGNELENLNISLSEVTSHLQIETPCHIFG